MLEDKYPELLCDDPADIPQMLREWATEDEGEHHATCGHYGCMSCLHYESLMAAAALLDRAYPTGITRGDLDGAEPETRRPVRPGQ